MSGIDDNSRQIIEVTPWIGCARTVKAVDITVLVLIRPSKAVVLTFSANTPVSHAATPTGDCSRALPTYSTSSQPV
ncbi:MAG TPA: hypothetical protein VJA21_22630 [Verrucomicrobiae bacterium]